MKRISAVFANASETGSRPRVSVNVAVTADGKIANADRSISSFGSAADRAHLLRLRAEADAVMCGAGTINAQPINLGPGPARYRRLRLKSGLAEYPLRIVVSGQGWVSASAEVFRHRFSPVVVLACHRITKTRLRRLKKVADEVGLFGDRELDWTAALRWLKQRWNVRRLLCEGGGEVNDSLFRAGLVDEVHLTLCPFVFGGREAPTLSDGRGFASLAGGTKLIRRKAQRIENELFLRYEVIR